MNMSEATNKDESAQQTENDDKTTETKPNPYKGFLARDAQNDKELEELERQRAAEENPDQGDPNEEGNQEDQPVDEEDKRYKKRYDDLRRHMNKLTEEKKELQSELQKLKDDLQKKVQQSGEVPTSKEEVEAWAKDNPQAYSILRRMIRDEAEESTKDTAERLKKIEAREQELERERQFAELKKRHPDIEDIQQDVKFHDWVDEQSKRIQDIVYGSTDPDDVSFVIDKYKADKGLTKQKKRDPKDAAKSVDSKARTNEPGDGKQQIRESDIERMSAAEYEQHEEEIEKAIREGRVIWDKTGAAR